MLGETWIHGPPEVLGREFWLALARPRGFISPHEILEQKGFSLIDRVNQFVVNFELTITVQFIN